MHDKTPGRLGPGADHALASLTSPKMDGAVRKAHLAHAVKCWTQRKITLPFERYLLSRWRHQRPGAARILDWGLPRHAMLEALGDALTVHVDPRQLIRIVGWRNTPKRPSSSAFIWRGDWDLQREDLRRGPRYCFISELDEHRHDLTRTEAYQRFMHCLESGTPWQSHQQGVLLDSPERIQRYLEVYIDFLDEMATHGFNQGKGKDRLGVAVSRDGTLLKINRGLHRLAMAQRIGLPSIPVQIQCVHEAWWNDVTRGAQGEAALAHVREALPLCRPETMPGPNDVETQRPWHDTDWPAPRTPS